MRFIFTLVQNSSRLLQHLLSFPTRRSSDLSSDPVVRYQTLQWLMFQMGGVGPMFGQVGFFTKFAGTEIEDPRPRERYLNESRRLLDVMNRHLAGKAWLAGDDYSIADIATFPWIRNLIEFYQAGDKVGIQDFTEVLRVLDAFVRRPAVQKGLEIPPRDP